MKTPLNDIHLAYDSRGDGPPCILIHGFPLCRQMWRPQVSALVKAGYRVITPDLRGFGESEAPDGPYSMSVYADDVVALMDRLEIEKAIIGGMSMGGYVLLNLLERHPGRVAAAMFLTTRAAADDEAGKVRRTALAHAVQEQGPHLVTTAFEQILFAPGISESRPELVSEVRSWMEATPPRGLEGGLLAMRDRKDFTPDLPLLDFPSLVIGAELDQTMSVELSHVLARELPRATLGIIPDAGHMANLEQPEAYNKCLIDFLQTLG
jgi:3-oxoadipate enol-lactonase